MWSKIFEAELGSAPGNMGKNLQITENICGSKNKTKFKLENVLLLEVVMKLVPLLLKECRATFKTKFKTKITSWYPEKYSCNFCKNYIYQISYI